MITKFEKEIIIGLYIKGVNRIIILKLILKLKIHINTSILFNFLNLTTFKFQSNYSSR